MSVAPGATVGILGGGQLGRMMALAARPLGYRLRVFDPDPDCAARPVVEEVVCARFDDAEAAARFADGCAVITLEIEKIAPEVLAACGRFAPVRPSAQVLARVQDRAVQKRWLARGGFPLASFWIACSADELADAVRAAGDGCFAKAARGGYDGRGQARLNAGDDTSRAFAALGGATVVVEQAVPLAGELSVLVARRPSGEVAVYPPAMNHHEDQILVWSVLPAPLDGDVTARATALARAIATAIDLEGLLVVELFLRSDGALLVNELAPRPHNSYHQSDVACVTSQFEQAIRAACDLPLGSTEVVRPAAIMNLLGDLWTHGAPNFPAALAIPGVRLSLYGKSPRPHRKVGHLVASATSPDQAVDNVRLAFQSLGVAPSGAATRARS